MLASENSPLDKYGSFHVVKLQMFCSLVHRININIGSFSRSVSASLLLSDSMFRLKKESGLILAF